MQKVVDEIKSHGGSPFEKFIEIYQFVTSHVYKENEQKRYASRDLISVLNGDDIVCVGFASMLKHMCTQVGIECSIVKCDNLKEDGEMSASHACNMVYLKDSKYKIDGYYHVDATRDAIKNEKDKYKNYNFCLVPISDMEKTIKKSRYRDEMETIYHSNETEMFYELFKDSVQVEKGLRFFGLDYEKRIQVDNKKYRRDRKDAINKLTSILRDKKIPSDFYMVMKNTPVIMHPYSLMALCFDYEANKDVIDFSLNQMKVYYDALKDKNKPSEKAFVEIDNVYEFLDDELYSDYSDIEYKTAALCVLKSKNIRLLLEKSKEVREGGKPISLKKYAKAIKFSQMNAGRNEDDAENFAKLALKHSVKRSVEKFEETASNVFRTKAQELLLQNGD